MIEIISTEYGRLSLPPTQPVEMDLGCGKGGFLTQLASLYPERLILGADVMLARLRKAEEKCRRAQVHNVRLLRNGAWPLVACFLPDRCLDRVHVLCPDPWPKRKHRANRLLTSEFLGHLSTKIKSGGVLHLATDNTDYFSFMQRAIEPLDQYRLDQDGIADVSDIKTDFERGFEADGIRVNHRAWRVLS